MYFTLCQINGLPKVDKVPDTGLIYLNIILYYFSLNTYEYQQYQYQSNHIQLKHHIHIYIAPFNETVLISSFVKRLDTIPKQK